MRLNGAGVMMWECTLDVLGWMPWPAFWSPFHEALFSAYIRFFFVIFIDVLMNVNWTSQPKRWDLRLWQSDWVVRWCFG